MRTRVERRWTPGRAIGLASLGLACAAGGVLPGVASGQGGWQQVTGIGGVPAINTDEIGLERTSDGVLHVAWSREASGTGALLHTPIAADGGSVGAPNQIYGAGVNNSIDLVAGPAGGLRVFFSGLAEGQPYNGVMATATAPASGAAWTTPAAASSNAVATSSPVYAASGIGAGVAAGIPISIWGDSSPSGGGIHLGIDPAIPDIALASSCCQVAPNIGVDAASGASVAAWSELGPPDGLQVLPLSPAGPVQTAPNSAAVGTGQRVSVSGRIGAPGIFAAYGAGTNPFIARPTLWQVGSPNAKQVKTGEGEHTLLAPAPGGRVWMAWDTESTRIEVQRTNAAATKFGAIVSVKPPSGTATIYRLAADGSAGPLDLLALVDTPSGLGFWHKRVLPGMTLKAKPKKVDPGQKVKFKVTDAGDPVGGAKVKLKLPGKDPKGTTKSSGKVKLEVPESVPPKRYKAKATKPGYTKAKTKVRVKG